MDESDSYASTSSYGPELTRTHPAQHLLLAGYMLKGIFFCSTRNRLTEHEPARTLTLTRPRPVTGGQPAGSKLHHDDASQHPRQTRRGASSSDDKVQGQEAQCRSPGRRQKVALAAG
jgi:hypothetical protein